MADSVAQDGPRLSAQTAASNVSMTVSAWCASPDAPLQSARVWLQPRTCPLHCARAGGGLWGPCRQCCSLLMGLPGCGSALPSCWRSLSMLSNYGFTLLSLLLSIPSRVLLGQGIATACLWMGFRPWALIFLFEAKGRSVKVPAGGNQQCGIVLMWASSADAEGQIRAANYLDAIKESN